MQLPIPIDRHTPRVWGCNHVNSPEFGNVGDTTQSHSKYHQLISRQFWIDPKQDEGRHAESRIAWQEEGQVMNSFGAFLKRRHGGRVQRVSIDAGFTCPNVDGAVARGGCNFCDNRSFSPSRRVRLQKVAEQLKSGIETVRRRYSKVSGFIAYFSQRPTPTPVDQLEEIFELALSIHPEIVGLAITLDPIAFPNLYH